MKKRKLILGSLAGIMFIVFSIGNITISKSYYKGDQKVGLSLEDIAVVAQNGDEKKCDSIEDCPAGFLSWKLDGVIYCCNQEDPVDTGHWDDVYTLR